MDYCELALTGVQKLHPYQPGKPVEELQRELGLREVIKLASNENPLGPSKKAIKAIETELHELARYPDGNGFVLKQALASHYKINPETITLGNGSNDVLELIARAFVSDSHEVVFSQHAFAVYPLVTQAIGAKAVVTPAKNWGHDLDAMANAITDNTRLIFIANPNNPTGTWLTKQDVVSFLRRVPDNVLVVLDEAYFEYASHSCMGLDDYPDGLLLQAEFPNLIVTRTFSKAYGLAGLRVGYAIAREDITNILNRVRQPFNVNQLSLICATQALADREHIDASIELNARGLTYLAAEFQRLGLAYIESIANFISFELPQDAAPVYTELLNHGIIVRPVANYGMSKHLRVSIGTHTENEKFINALESVLRT